MTQPEFRSAGRTHGIGVSEILKIANLASDLKRQGRDIVDLSTGEPDFDTPEPIKDAAMKAMRHGATKYTLLGGMPELKEAIQAKFRRENGLDYELAEIIASAGAKQVLFNAMMATLDHDDEVILPAPYWTSYVDMIKIARGKPVAVTCTADAGFLLTPDDLEAAINDRTRWLILNSPSNPTGATYSRSHLQTLIDVLKRYPHVSVLADDIYEHIIYDGAKFVSPAMMDAEIKDRTLVVNGVSKAYAMTGWRIGYGCGPEPLIKSMLVVQSQATSCPCSVSQVAAIAALNGSQDIVHERCGIFQRRRDLVVKLLNDIDGISCDPPKGAFYIFASCDGLIGSQTQDGRRIVSDVDVAEFLLQEAGVAVVPGAPFGLSPFFRISIAAGKAELEESCARIKRACTMLDLAGTGS